MKGDENNMPGNAKETALKTNEPKSRGMYLNGRIV